MTPRELFEAGRLDEAIEAQNAQVRARPTDLDARTFLFVLLAFAGELERASTILDGLTRIDPQTAQGVGVFQSLIASEYERAKVWNGGASPVMPPDAPAHLSERLEALRAAREGDGAAVDAALERALAGRSPVVGKLNGEPIDDLRDYDDLLASVLEVHAGGRYLWLPFEHVRRLEIDAPANELELLWIPAHLEDRNGETARVHLPALYPGSSECSTAAARIGRVTEWLDICGVAFRGAGQKVWLSARGDEAVEVPLLEIRSLELTT